MHAASTLENVHNLMAFTACLAAINAAPFTAVSVSSEKRIAVLVSFCILCSSKSSRPSNIP